MKMIYQLQLIKRDSNMLTIYSSMQLGFEGVDRGWGNPLLSHTKILRISYKMCGLLGTIDFLHFELGVDRARILPARVEPSQISFFQSPARAEPA